MFDPRTLEAETRPQAFRSHRACRQFVASSRRHVEKYRACLWGEGLILVSAILMRRKNLGQKNKNKNNHEQYNEKLCYQRHPGYWDGLVIECNIFKC